MLLSEFEAEVLGKAKRLQAADQEWSVTLTFPPGRRAAEVADELIVKALQRDLVVQQHIGGALLSKHRVVHLKGNPMSVAAVALTARRLLPGFTVTE